MNQTNAVIWCMDAKRTKEFGAPFVARSGR